MAERVQCATRQRSVVGVEQPKIIGDTQIADQVGRPNPGYAR